MKRTNSLIIIVTMMVGVVAGAFIYSQALNLKCPTPPTGGNPETVGQVGFATVNGAPYLQLNVTFTAVDQVISIGSSPSVSFKTSGFFDPNFSHLKNGACISEPNLPFQVGLQVSFNDGTTPEILYITYGGSPPANPTAAFSGHQHPTAGVEWTLGTNYLTLLLSQS